MSIVDSAFLVWETIKIGARSGGSKAEARWVKVCDEQCCHRCQDAGFKNKHGENALKNPESGV